MRSAETIFYEINTVKDLPERLSVGSIYFVKDVGQIHINHGDRTVVYNAPRKLSFIGDGMTGDVEYNDKGEGSVTLTPGPDVELTINRDSPLPITPLADDVHYPTSKAVRDTLDSMSASIAMALSKKLDASEYKQAFRGSFATPAELPAGVMGDFAVVVGTNSVWTVNAQGVWEDSGSMEGLGVTAVNGVRGAEINLDIEENLDGYNRGHINDMFSAASMALEDLKEYHDGTQAARTMKRSNVTLSREIGASTMVAKGAIYSAIPGPITMNDYATQVVDADGTMGLVIGQTAADVTIRTLTTTIYGLDRPFLLGNVPTKADLPLTVTAGTALWGRPPVVDCYARVVTDESWTASPGATVEYHIVQITGDAITWDTGIPLNTSDYQEQTLPADAGKIPIAGTVAGQWGTPLDPTSFGAGIAAVAVADANEYTDDQIELKKYVPAPGVESGLICTTLGITNNFGNRALNVEIVLGREHSIWDIKTGVKIVEPPVGSLVWDQYGSCARLEAVTADSYVFKAQSSTRSYVPPFGSDYPIYRLLPDYTLNSPVNASTIVPKAGLVSIRDNTALTVANLASPRALVIDRNGSVGITVTDEAAGVRMTTQALGYTPPANTHRVFFTAVSLATSINGDIELTKANTIWGASPQQYVADTERITGALIISSGGRVGNVRADNGATVTVRTYAQQMPDTPKWFYSSIPLKQPITNMKLTDLIQASGQVSHGMTKDEVMSSMVHDINGTLGWVSPTNSNLLPDDEVAITIKGISGASAPAPVMPKALFSRTALSSTIGGTATIGLANFRIFHTNGATPTVADFIPGSQFVYDANNRAGFVETFTPSSASNGSAVIRTMNSGGLLNL